MWWNRGFEWFEGQFIALIGKLPAIKRYLDENGDGDVSLEEVWAKVKLCVSTADMFVTDWQNLSPTQKQEAVAAMVKRAFPNMKDSLIYTLINVAVLLWKVYKVVK